MKRYYDGRRLARRFTELVLAPGIPRVENNKLVGRKVAEELGIRCPTQLAFFPSQAEIDLSGMPDRFVLKADNLETKRGAYVLNRVGPDAFHDRLSGQVVSTQYMRDDIAKWRMKLRGTSDGGVLVEEYIVGENGENEIPYDYKFFVFDGVPEMCIQVSREVSPVGIAFFDGNFEPFEMHHITVSARAQLIPHVRPKNWQDLVDAARRVSLHLDIPFVGVDMYTTGTEVVFGELTPTPGAPRAGLWRMSEVLDGEYGTYYRLGMKRRGVPTPQVEGLPLVLTKHESELKAERMAAKGQRSRIKELEGQLARLQRPGIRASLRLLGQALRRSLAGRLRGKR